MPTLLPETWPYHKIDEQLQKVEAHKYSYAPEVFDRVVRIIRQVLNLAVNNLLIQLKSLLIVGEYQVCGEVGRQQIEHRYLDDAG